MNRRKALITGASRGIGKAIAGTFAKAGYDLYLTCHTRKEELEEFSKRLSDKLNQGLEKQKSKEEKKKEQKVNKIIIKINKNRIFKTVDEKKIIIKINK